MQEGETFARSLEIYYNAVVTQMLPAIDLSVDAAAEMMHAADQYAIGDGLACDALWHWQLEIRLVRNHALAFSFVTVFHLFERHLLTAVNWTRYRAGRKATTAKRRVRGLLDELEKDGVLIEPEFRREADRLRMIANVIKHSGHDLISIARQYPDLVHNWRPGMQVTPETLAVTPELLEGFVRTLTRFWRAFPHE